MENIIKNVIKELYGLNDINVELSQVPNEMNGDVACNIAMRLAARLKKNPRQIAEEIVEKLRELNDGFTLNIAGPGFINISYPDDYYKSGLEKLLDKFDDVIKIDDYKDKIVLCEFSDPNPFKVLHVGHLYTSVVGDAIARLFEFAGANVKRLNFGGDVGIHVAKTLYEVQKQDDFLNDDKLSLDEKAEHIGKCYVAGTRAYEEDDEAKKKIVQINKELYEISENDKHDSRLSELYWKGREISYNYFKKFYASIGLTFDKYYPESVVARGGLERVKKELENGVYEESNGAIVFKGEKYGLHTRVFVNKEGVPTYEAKDVGLVLAKWADWHFDKSIIITGSEQKEYMAVVYKSIEQYEPELVKKTTHLTHGMVRLPGDEKMSSRKGNFLKAVDTIGVIEQNLKELGGSYDEKIVMGALKYAFLKYKMGGNIVFDAKESVSMSGNSGIYLQYSAVRAKKILEKSLKKDSNDTGWVLNEFEKDLIREMLEFGDVLREALNDYAPYKICNYLYSLAQMFSRFYENVQVAGSEHEKDRKKIVKVYISVLEKGLDLLGIELPEKM